MDNPHVWEEMKKARAPGAAHTFEESIRNATWEDLNPQAYIDEVMVDENELLKKQLAKVEYMKTIPKNTSPVDLNAHITLSYGEETIATNEKSFENMCDVFSAKIASLI